MSWRFDDVGSESEMLPFDGRLWRELPAPRRKARLAAACRVDGSSRASARRLPPPPPRRRRVRSYQR